MEDQKQKRITSVIFKEEALEKLYRGIDITAKAVCSTMGPGGKTVLIQREGESPIVTKDGVTVSKSLNLKDPVERMGSELIREAANRTNEVAGDGTTTATALAYSMITQSLNLLKAGYSATKLKAGMDWGKTIVLQAINDIAIPVTSKNDIEQIATISANGDKNVGEIISRAMEKVGQNGVITVEDAKGTETSLDIIEGMKFERGYLSPYFVTNNDRMVATYDDCYVLVANCKLTSLQDILLPLEEIHKVNGSILIIADDIEGEALQALVLNKVKAKLKIIAIKSPGYGAVRDNFLNDICVLTGAKLASASQGLSVNKMKLTDMGKCKKVIVDVKSTTIIADSRAKENVLAHVEMLKNQLVDITLSPQDINTLNMRIARLSSGVAVIRVGGSTELEMIELKYRIEDALNAARVAVAEGILPGGGVTLLRISLIVSNTKKPNLDKDFLGGVDIMINACLAPLIQIIKNIHESSDLVMFNILNSGNSTQGYDAANGKLVDMIESGIIDPAKVTKAAIENACSVTSTFMSIDSVISNEE